MQGAIRAIAACAALAAAWWAMPAKAYQSRQIRDYYVVCSNGLTCELAIHNFDTPLTGLAVERGGGPSSPVTIRFDMAMALEEGSEVTVAVDGAAPVRFPVSAMTADADDLAYRLSEAAHVDALVGAFQDGNSAEIGYRTAEGETSSPYSLAGMKAGMLFMDEAQGRLNATDALVSKGEREPDAPAVRDIATVEALPVAIRGQFADKQGDCYVYDAKQFGRGSGFEAQLSDTAFLIGVPCGSPGAYNQPYVFFVRAGEHATPLHLPVMTQFGPSTEPYAWNVSWKHRERIMEGFFKGRGVGDCGVFSRWVLNDEMPEPAFILREMRVKEDCDGDNMGGVEFWPPVWPLQ